MKLSEKQSMFCGPHFEHSQKKRESVNLEGEMLAEAGLGISWDYPSQLTQLTRAQVQFNAKPRNTRQRNEVYNIYRVFFSHWYSPKKLKYGKPRLGESTLT